MSHVQEIWGDRKTSEQDKTVAMMDPKAEWPFEMAGKLLDLAKDCLKDKNDRPFMPEVLRKLRDIWDR